MSELHKNRFYGIGWKIWLIQNFIFLIPVITCIPVFSTRLFLIAASLDIIDYTSIVINYIFNFTLLLDLISIFIISLSTLLVFYPSKEEYNYRRKEIYIPIMGVVWIIFSLLWRFPFFFGGGFDLGFTRTSYWDLEDNKFYTNLLNNPLLAFFQLLGAICLFFFLYLQEEYLKPLSDEKRKNNIDRDIEFGIGRATVLGIINTVAVFFLFFGSNLTARTAESMDIYGVRPNGLFLLIGILFKIIIIPLLTIWVCWKFISLTRFTRSKLTEFSKEKIPSEPIGLDKV